ncbi:hypothetical protein Goklo_017867 [Gossypium klotzschianum]|uniref:Uncharacterized protein n=1 Tax=Gossypium klotzschianum TaxID=34286 RepID=A0A7J8UJM1_9ROSI|nr:hypothetical protein [Gossypium klotzschianum]
MSCDGHEVVNTRKVDWGSNIASVGAVAIYVTQNQILPQDNCLATTKSFRSQFDAYKKVNKLFADVVNEHYEEGDVVCFHVYDYARHFVCACTRILGCPRRSRGLRKVDLRSCNKELTSQVHEIVGRINGRFGTLTDAPIHHLDHSLDFHTLCTLYAVTSADFYVALVTSLRDGMNLASYEFVACQASNKDFAGAAQSLGAGAILVNPWNVTGVADEREKRHCHNFMHVTSHTSQEWATSFVSELNETIVEAQSRTRRIQPSLLIEVAVDRYTRLNNQLHILGFNATLTEPLDTLGRKGSQINWSQSYIRIYENPSIMCCKRKYEFGKRILMLKYDKLKLNDVLQLVQDEGIHFFELKYPSEVPASASPQEPTSVGTSAAGSIAAHLKRQRSMLTVEGNKSYS